MLSYPVKKDVRFVKLKEGMQNSTSVALHVVLPWSYKRDLGKKNFRSIVALQNILYISRAIYLRCIKHNN